MPILDLQRRGQQIGRLRIGQQVRADNGKMRPARLDTFRFTTQSRAAADAIAALYGGTVRDWEGQYEVITDKSEIPVTVPPRDQVVSQWYEMWNKGGAVRRCDSQRDQISGGPCLCPHAADTGDEEDVQAKAKERSRLASLNPPQACKLVTRISVMIPDLPGLGVFRLDSGSYYAAAEIGDSAELMQMARDKGVFLPAILRIEHRSRVAGGQTKKFPVPVLEVLATFRDLATGAIERGGMAAQLPPAPGEPLRAITAAPAPAPVPAPATPVRGATGPRGFDARLAQIAGGEIAQAAQQIARLALGPVTPGQMRAIRERAKQLGVMDDNVCTEDEDDNEVWETLRAFLEGRWEELKAAGRAHAAAPEAGAA